MISLVGNKWEGYTVTRQYDPSNEIDKRNAFEHAREKISLRGVNRGCDIPTSTFERVAMEHGMYKNKFSVTEKF